MITYYVNLVYVDDVRLPPPQPPLSHFAPNHTHDNDTVYIITDTYARVVEGENVTMCAELSRPVDDDVKVYITTELSIILCIMTKVNDQ